MKNEQGIKTKGEGEWDGKSIQSNGDVWVSQSRRSGLHKHAFKSSVGVLFMTVRGREEDRGRGERIDSDSYADNLMLMNLSCCIINSVKYLWINNGQDDEGVFAPVLQLRKTLHMCLFCVLCNCSLKKDQMYQTLFYVTAKIRIRVRVLNDLRSSKVGAINIYAFVQ